MFNPCLPQGRRRLWIRRLVQACGLAALVMVSIVGGMLNRVRGGWGNCPNPQLYLLDDGVLTHDGFPRFLVASTTGLLAALLCSLRWPWPSRRTGSTGEAATGESGVLAHFAARFLVWCLVTFMVYFGLFVGWGVYYSIGRNTSGYTSRPGVFDYLIGKECEGWGFARRWLLEYSGMSLRGLVQTVPVGYFMLVVIGGLGPLLEARYSDGWHSSVEDQRRGISCGLSIMLSGLCMGLMYELGWDTPSTVPNFSTGTELGELYWGTWSWWMLMLPLVTYARGYSQETNDTLLLATSSYGAVQGLDDSNRPPPVGPRSRLSWRDHLRKLFAFGFMLSSVIIFLGAVVTYGRLKQGDSTNKNQSWLGMCQAVGTVALVHCLASVGVWYSGLRSPELRHHSRVRDCTTSFSTTPEEVLVASTPRPDVLGTDGLSNIGRHLYDIERASFAEGGLKRRRTRNVDQTLAEEADEATKAITWWKSTIELFVCQGRQPFATVLTLFNTICALQLMVVATSLLLDIVGNWALGSCNIDITASYEASM